MRQSGRMENQQTTETTHEWGLEHDGQAFALPSDVPMAQESAEAALAELREWTGDETAGRIVRREVGPWMTEGGEVEPTAGIRSNCPTCEGPNRETVNMVCPTCGFDHGSLIPSPAPGVAAPAESRPEPASSGASAGASVGEALSPPTWACLGCRDQESGRGGPCQRHATGLGALIERTLTEHWPNSGVNAWYLADLLRDAGVRTPPGQES